MNTETEVFQGNQIGGCVTVISHTDDHGGTHRIMIDYGASLPGKEPEKDFDYPWEEEPVDAVFFTHCHADHIGRIAEIPEDIPLYMGDTTRRVMLNILNALCRLPDHEPDGVLERLSDNGRVHVFENEGKHYKTITDIPGFSIEPYHVDHSAYDSYMFLVETPDDTKRSGKKVILHTGDYRDHGRTGKALLPVIRKYIRKNGRRDVDVLITEGTMMSRASGRALTEHELQQEAEKYLRDHRYAFLICSSTNLDSLAGFYQAAKAADGRYMYVYNEYVRSQLETFSETAGKYSDVYRFDHVYKLDPERRLKSPLWKDSMSQKEFMEKTGFLAIIKPEDYCEKYIDLFLDSYCSGRIPEKPVIIYSLWGGYIDGREGNTAANGNWVSFFNRQKEKGVEIRCLHTGGHATAETIAKVITAVDPREGIIPIHTEDPEGFLGLEIGEELKGRIRMA